MSVERKSLTGLCADLCACMGVEPPKLAEPALGDLKALCGEARVDRIVMYNPDAQAEWLVKKYPELYRGVIDNSKLAVPLTSVMQSVTPVCFATMYTGAFPEAHGIHKYEKPILRVDTIFDAMLRAGKRCAIVASAGCSVASIFLEREMDYFIFPASAEADEQIVQKGLELIAEDKYDFLVIYNGMYDSAMHKTSPEDPAAIKWIEHHVGAYVRIHEKVAECSRANGHMTLLAFATDHGVHTNEKGRGSHGADIPEDMQITHYYDVMC